MLKRLLQQETFKPDTMTYEQLLQSKHLPFATQIFDATESMFNDENEQFEIDFFGCYDKSMHGYSFVVNGIRYKSFRCNDTNSCWMTQQRIGVDVLPLSANRREFWNALQELVNSTPVC